MSDSNTHFVIYFRDTGTYLTERTAGHAGETKDQGEAQRFATRREAYERTRLFRPGTDLEIFKVRKAETIIRTSHLYRIAYQVKKGASWKLDETAYEARLAAGRHAEVLQDLNYKVMIIKAPVEAVISEGGV